MRNHLSVFRSGPGTFVSQLILTAGILLAIGSELSAQHMATDWPFHFITRLVATGDSHLSTPAGYKAYSSIHFDASLRRSLTPVLAVELNLAHESRKVDFMAPDEEISLGSMEMLPINITVQFHSRLKNWHPYLGVGVNYSIFWEKSGELNRKKLSPSLGPTAQLGLVFPLSPHAFLNVDVKFMTLKTDFEGLNKETVKLALDPMVMGVGLGFQF